MMKQTFKVFQPELLRGGLLNERLLVAENCIGSKCLTSRVFARFRYSTKPMVSIPRLCLGNNASINNNDINCNLIQIPVMTSADVNNDRNNVRQTLINDRIAIVYALLLLIRAL